MNNVSDIDWYKPIESQVNFDYYMPFYDLQIESIKKKAQEDFLITSEKENDTWT